jgi:membrane protease YdiL (CAAX protease family)
MNALPSVEQPRARRWSVPAAVALGCAALAARNISLFALAPTIAIGVLGVAGTVRRRDVAAASRARIVAVTLVGVAAVVVVRAIAPPIHAAYTPEAFTANVVAAIAEEAFFRRFVYAWLAARGETLAIVGAAALFAVIHVPIYGPGVLPIDFAAGLLLGWQRREAGTWTSPAFTHIVANILQMR